MMNEETLRNHLLVPYLRALQLSSDEIQIEERFSIRLGRQIHELRSSVKSGRADLLVRNANGENLFIVEIKRPGSPLTDDDRDQGISYARLLDQIAPFVLVTNGENSQLFDVITKKAIDSDEMETSGSFYSSGYQLALEEDIRIRWEALSHFIGYSIENVRTFSRLQIEAHLESLKGEVGNSGKYIRDLYVARDALRREISSFLDSSKIAFVVMGDSGVGKSNEMCALAEELSASHIVLFRAAYTFTTGPIEAILDEFNWSFSHQIGAPELFDRLARIARKTGMPIIIIVDGLDEATIDNFPQLMSEFAARIRSMEGFIKLIVSVKSTEWARFEQIRNNFSGLALALRASLSGSADCSSPSGRGEPFLLDEFSEDEYAAASKKYQRVYNLPGHPEGQLKVHCHVPLWLRVVSETYANTHGPLPVDITGSDIARTWLERKFASMAEPEKARQDLLNVVEEIRKESRRIDRQTVTLAMLESVPASRLETQPSRELITHGIINRSMDEHGRVNFSLKHSRILSYLLARHILCLDKASDEEFRALVPELLSNHVLDGALGWHLREGAYRHAGLLCDELDRRAERFLDKYTEILDSVVPGLRSSLEPRTAGTIGMAYSTYEYGLGQYGVFPVDGENSTRVIRVNSNIASSWDEDGTSLYKLGCTSIRGLGQNFANRDPEWAAALFVHEGASKALENGALDESASEALRLESILAICTAYREKLGFACNRLRDHPFETIIPVDLLKLQPIIQRWFGKEFYLRQWREEQHHKLLEERRNLDDVTDAYYPPYGFNLEIEKKVSKEVEDGMTYSPPNNRDMGDIAMLPDLIDSYLDQGIKTIDTTPLPLPDLMPGSRGVFLPDFYSDNALVSLIQTFFSAGFSAYKCMVESNFPGVRFSFPTYTHMPFKVFAAYTRPDHALRHGEWGRFEWGVTDLQADEDITPSVIINPTEPMLRREGPPRSHLVISNGRRMHSWTVSDLSSYFSPHSASGRRNTSAYSDSVRNAPIRAFAYDLLKKDFQSVKTEDFLSPAFNQ